MSLREWRHRGRYPRKQHCRADRAKRAVHLPREQRECRGDSRAHRRVARERECRDRPVRDDDVREGGREDEVGARAIRHRREHRHDPVHPAIRRERQPEKRDGHQHATHLPHPKSEFRRRLLVVGVLVTTVPP